jgi:hypothetical protein
MLNASARFQLNAVACSIPSAQRQQPCHLSPKFGILNLLFIKYRPLWFEWNHLGKRGVACALGFQNRGDQVHADANLLEVGPTNRPGSLIPIRAAAACTAASREPESFTAHLTTVCLPSGSVMSSARSRGR